MNLFMRKIGSSFGQEVDMVRELGSFNTGSMEGALLRGTLIHVFFGVIFGMAYLATWQALGLIDLALVQTAFLGLGFGFLHGMVFSYMLMFLVRERHPIEQYRQVTLQTGIIHLIGHMMYGFAVGIIAHLLLKF